MKKIPTMFKRIYDGHNVVDITEEFTNPECERALKEGLPYIKWDGACCALINGEFYKRYDAKNGKKPPEGAIPCCNPDSITGHWPHWVKVGDGPEDRWFREAYVNTFDIRNGSEAYDIWLSRENPDTVYSYEAIGPHFQSNPYKYKFDYLVLHCRFSNQLRLNEIPRTFEEVRAWLYANREEGLVYWLNGEPVCKIKRSDFGLPWPVKEMNG
jgi:hypothetical protein